MPREPRIESLRREDGCLAADDRCRCRQAGGQAGGRWPRESVTKQQEVTGLVIRQISEWTQGHTDPVLRDSLMSMHFRYRVGQPGICHVYVGRWFSKILEES